MRFQPRIGQLMAAAAGHMVSIFDVENDTQIHSLPVCAMNANVLVVLNVVL